MDQNNIMSLLAGMPGLAAQLGAGAQAQQQVQAQAVNSTAALHEQPPLRTALPQQQQQDEPAQQVRPREALPEQHHAQYAAPLPPAQPGPPGQKSLRKGSRVRLVGLQSMPFLNGAEGRIADSFDKESGTFPVELHTPPQVAQAYPSVSVRPGNLERLAPLTQPATTRVWSARADDDYREPDEDGEDGEPVPKKRRSGPNFDILKSVSCFVTSGEYSIVDDDTAQERPPTQEEKETIVLPGPDEAVIFLPMVQELASRPLRLASPVTLHTLMMSILRAYAPYDEVEVFFEGLKHVQGNTWKMQYGT